MTSPINMTGPSRLQWCCGCLSVYQLFRGESQGLLVAHVAGGGHGLGLTGSQAGIGWRVVIITGGRLLLHSEKANHRGPTVKYDTLIGAWVGERRVWATWKKTEIWTQIKTWMNQLESSWEANRKQFEGGCKASHLSMPSGTSPAPGSDSWRSKVKWNPLLHGTQYHIHVYMF